MQLNEKIKKIREDAKLSQRAFAENVGISGAAIAHIESGVNNPSEQTLRLISTVFKVNYDWLAEGRGEPYLPPDTDDELVDEVMAGANEFAKKAFRAFARLSDADWQVIKRIVDELKSED